jgi:hypothetical protein
MKFRNLEILIETRSHTRKKIRRKERMRFLQKKKKKKKKKKKSDIHIQAQLNS